MFTGKRVLVAILDWGLGHAARSAAIVRICRTHGFEPILAGSGASLDLLRMEFPDAEQIRLPPYGIRYPFGNMYLNLALQTPRILWTIRQENKKIIRLVKEKRIDLILSDCRFGCYHPDIPSVLITHQLSLPAPGMAGRVAKAVYRHWMSHFKEIWVPDRPGKHNLSGDLSTGFSSKPVRFIGPLSRMQKLPTTGIYDLFVLLSGPEPQRTILERRLLAELVQFEGRAVLVRGTRGERPEAGRTTVIDYADGALINQLLAASRLVVCRPGYSTLMDLAVMGSRALLIPTPGQKEQEYLGRRSREMKWSGSYTQAGFNLKSAMAEADGYTGFPSESVDPQTILSAFQALLDSLSTSQINSGS